MPPILDPHIDRLIAAAEARGENPGMVFEKLVAAFIQHFTPHGGWVVDIGANNGFHTQTMAASVGKLGRVDAFEPLPGHYQKLKKRFPWYRTPQVHLHNLALGAEDGTHSFTFFENFPAFSGLERRVTKFSDEEGGRQEITVDVRMLSPYLESVSGWTKPTNVSLIKLDIEGGEYHALMGGRDVLKKDRPVMVFENGRQQAARVYGYDRDDFFALFDEIDYDIFTAGGTPFHKDDWNRQVNCWEFFAFPRERRDEHSVLPQLIDHVVVHS